MKKNTIISSIIFKTIERFSVKFIGLVIGVILARILSPDIFGQLAVIVVFINLSQVFVQSGLNTALVQKKDITDDDYSTVFYISLVISLLLIIILWITAPFIAGYYGYSKIINPLKIYSLSLLVCAFNSIQVAKAQKEMAFKKMMVINLIASLISGALGILAAKMGAEIWAMIIYYFSNTVIATIGMLFVTNWLPKLVFSVKRAKVLFDFGWKILVSALLCSFYNDLRTLIIGKKFSASDLGYYNKGYQFPEVIAYSLDTSIQSVMFPALSEVQDDKEKLTAYMRRALLTSTFFIVPIMLGMAAVSNQFVYVLLTEKWMPAAPYMFVLALANAFLPMLTANLIPIKALGRSDVYMRLEIVRRIAMIIVLAISVIFFKSAMAIAVGWLISSIIDVMISTVPIKKLIGYGLFAQIRDIWKNLVSSFIMGVIVFFIGFIPISSMLLKLIIQVLIGVFIYILLAIILKNETFIYILNNVKKLIKSSKCN